MNTRTVLVAGLVTLLVAVTGCARPDVTSAWTPPPRPVVAYGLGADHVVRNLSLDQTTRGASTTPAVQTHAAVMGSPLRALKPR